eukprot:6624266-Pyramimonas_sp.AAC.1
MAERISMNIFRIWWRSHFDPHCSNWVVSFALVRAISMSRNHDHSAQSESRLWVACGPFRVLAHSPCARASPAVMRPKMRQWQSPLSNLSLDTKRAIRRWGSCTFAEAGCVSRGRMR